MDEESHGGKTKSALRVISEYDHLTLSKSFCYRYPFPSTFLSIDFKLCPSPWKDFVDTLHVLETPSS